MLLLISNSGKIFLLRGAVAIIFGLTALFWPRFSPDTMVLSFGFFALAEAVLSFAAGLSKFAGKNNSIMFEGVGGLIVAIFTFIGPGIGIGKLFGPEMPSITTLFLVVIWTLIVGICQMVEGIQLRQEMRGEWSLVVSSLLSFLCTLILILRWEGGALAMSLTIGFYSILYGSLHVLMTLRVRKFTGHV